MRMSFVWRAFETKSRQSNLILPRPLNGEKRPFGEIRSLSAIASSLFYRLKNGLPVVTQILRCKFDENEPMFPDADDAVSLHSQISELQRAITQQERVFAELQRLGEPTVLTAKFLGRLQTRLSERQKHLARLTHAAADEDT